MRLYIVFYETSRERAQLILEKDQLAEIGSDVFVCFFFLFSFGTKLLHLTMLLVCRESWRMVNLHVCVHKYNCILVNEWFIT